MVEQAFQKIDTDKGGSVDPKELKNLAAENPAIVRQIDAIMHEAHVENPNWKVPGVKQAPAKKSRQAA